MPRYANHWSGAVCAGKKEQREKAREEAAEGAAGSKEKLEALKQRALARRQAGVGKKARLGHR